MVTSHPYFFQGINFKKLLRIAFSLGLTAALINSLTDMNTHRAQFMGWLELLQNLSLYASCCLLALVFAEKTPLECFLIRRETAWSMKGLLLLGFGLIPGGVMAITYHRLFAPYRFSSRVPVRIRAIENHYDTFLLSLRAAVTEELVFRFLLLTAFFYILKKIFRPLIDEGFGITQWIPFLFSLLLSSLLFGVVHGTYGFMIAFLAGIGLGIVYFKAGLESAILAHFLADFFFFNMTYL